jgi:alginate O-acetyltransferase complex protein AlgI
MVFSSTLFLLYFLPLFLLIYTFSPRKLKNYVILLASILFYSWGAPKFVFVILASTILDFHIVKALSKSTKTTERKLLLALSITINLGLLAFFKYANFFVENVNGLLSSFGASEIAWTAIALPIGISFYTFQTLTYSIDIYRGVHKPLEKVSDYLLYIMSFPQMIAGPIVRFSTIADEITGRKDTVNDKLLGFYRFAIGLAKKVLIANVMGEQADLIMGGDLNSIDTATAWIGILAYTFQIYFDFSGYSDMAIGLGRMMGFSFPENFNAPYISQSISEFWRRWHITLGTFMRDYLYIPLGGNRVQSAGRLYFNLSLVFLLSGLWHGASWNFVLWGGYHGLFLILDRLFLLKVLKKLGKWPSIVITFFFTMIGWVIFRLENMQDIVLYIKKLFAFHFNTEELYETIPSFSTILCLAIFFSFITSFKLGDKWKQFFFEKKHYLLKEHLGLTALTILFIMLSVASITSSGFNPFIYFRF